MLSNVIIVNQPLFWQQLLFLFSLPANLGMGHAESNYWHKNIEVCSWFLWLIEKVEKVFMLNMAIFKSPLNWRFIRLLLGQWGKFEYVLDIRYWIKFKFLNNTVVLWSYRRVALFLEDMLCLVVSFMMSTNNFKMSQKKFIHFSQYLLFYLPICVQNVNKHIKYTLSPSMEDLYLPYVYGRGIPVLIVLLLQLF